MTGPGAALIARLGLARHPEGGWFRETYRAPERIPAAALPRHGGDRPCSTAILFLLEAGDISALHRLASDELWHWHAGAPLRIHALAGDGGHQVHRLGPDLEAGQSFQAVLPAGTWFGAEVEGPGYTLVGCTVAPGFDFADFELARREDLLALHPRHAALVAHLTRG